MNQSKESNQLRDFHRQKLQTNKNNNHYCSKKKKHTLNACNKSKKDKKKNKQKNSISSYIFRFEREIWKRDTHNVEQTVNEKQKVGSQYADESIFPFLNLPCAQHLHFFLTFTNTHCELTAEKLKRKITDWILCILTI